MPNLKVWSSLEISKLKRDMDRLFESLCSDLGLPDPFCREEMQVEEDEEEIRVILALPGLSAENMDVKVTEYGLVISGCHEKNMPGGRSVQRFSRRMELPCRVVPGAVKAMFREGALRITLPKCTDAQCRSIDIVKE